MKKIMRNARVIALAALASCAMVVIAASTASADYPPIAVPGTPVVTAGGMETISFTNLLPNTLYHIVVHSDPVDLGEHASDATGAMTLAFSTVGLDTGAHTVAATAPNGDVVTASFTVQAATSAGGSGIAAPSPDSPSGLAFTGAQVDTAIGVALLLIGCGLAAVRLSRRRKN